MKKIFIIVLLLSFVFNTYSQNQTIERIKVLKTGTSELVNGKMEIKLDSKAEQYSVIFTPIGEFAELYLETKDVEKFVVKSKNTQNTKFDYVVIEKRVKTKELPEIDLNKKN